MQSLSLYLPGFIVAFREGLEALLIIVVLMRFLEKTNHTSLIRNIWIGGGIGIIISIIVGWAFFWLGNFLGTSEGIGKIWESLMSLLAVGLIISFVIWMIHHGKHIKAHIENEAMTHLSSWGILLISTVCIAREGVEIVIFSYAGKYPWQGILGGIAVAIFIAICLYVFSIRAKLTLLFNITLLYLIFQCGYLLGYSIHEGISALKELHIIGASNPLTIKAFDLSQTILNHKEGIIGLPFNILFGWYAKPEWIQCIAQYLCTGILFWVWMKSKTKQRR